MLSKLSDFFQIENIEQSFSDFKGALPFDHCVIDGFINTEIAKLVEDEFLDFNDSNWYEYKNAIENKKALNNWNHFPPLTYKVFSLLNSKDFLKLLSERVGTQLYPDNGLHGGGWHIHGAGGNLNPHYDYSIHPKLGLQRKINIIIYLSSALKPTMGGDLGLWKHNYEDNSLGDLVKEVSPIFNRAVVFDTTQNSWHGMSKILDCPHNVFRKSLAVYYLCEPDEKALKHQRAVFSPRENQQGDEAIEELIRKRSDVTLSKSVYKDSF